MLFGRNGKPIQQKYTHEFGDQRNEKKVPWLNLYPKIWLVPTFSHGSSLVPRLSRFYSIITLEKKVVNDK